jgi:hypothetical protein
MLKGNDLYPGKHGAIKHLACPRRLLGCRRDSAQQQQWANKVHRRMWDHFCESKSRSREYRLKTRQLR